MEDQTTEDVSENSNENTNHGSIHHNNNNNINNNNNGNGNNKSMTCSDEKTYHFRKGPDVDGFDSFGALFADGLFTDMVIACNGKLFKCHRVVMAASSEYLKNALSVFNGENSNTVMIMPEDIRVSDMEAILHFIYNGQVEVTRDQMESFLSSAKQLHVKGLANIKLVYNSSNKINVNNNNVNNNKKRKNNNMLQSDLNRFHSRNDLNFSNFKTSSQKSITQSPHSTKNNSNNSYNNRRKQIFPNTETRRDSSIINGYGNESCNNDDSQWITITDEEEDNENEEHERDIDDEENIDCKEELKPNMNGNDKMLEDPLSIQAEDNTQMPCLIQVDADPTTFPSYCPQSNGVKRRRRSSSLKSVPDLKPMTPALTAVVNNSSDTIVKPNRSEQLRKSGHKVNRTSNRKFNKYNPLTIHKSSFWGSSKWKCDICNKLYGNKQTLKEHMDYFHSNREEQIFSCTICNKEYTWKKSLMKHYRDMHQISQSSMKDLEHKQTTTALTSAQDISNASQDT